MNNIVGISVNIIHISMKLGMILYTVILNMSSNLYYYFVFINL